MRNVLILLGCMAMSVYCSAQYVYTINADSVKITNRCDSAELIIQNHTQGVTGGFLYNTINGRTIFKKVLLQLNDSTYLIGPDTLKLASGSPNLQKVTNGSGNNITTNSMYTYDSVYSVRSAVHGTLYVGDSATYAPRTTQDTIYGYGNSIIQGVGASDGSPFFVQYCNYVNAFPLDSGVSGMLLTDFQVRLHLIPNWTPHHKIMLLYETNDYYASTPLSTYLSEYANVINSLEIEKGYADTSIILLFCSLSGYTSGSLTPAGMGPWANSLDSLAGVYGVPHVDLYHYMVDNGGSSLIYLPLTEHPNQAGHNVIADDMILSLNKGGASFKRPIVAQSIKSGQQLILDAPVTLITGDRIRQSESDSLLGNTDYLTYSNGSNEVRSEIRGGRQSARIVDSYVTAASNQGNNIETGFAAYTLTDTVGTPLSGSLGFKLFINPDNGATFLSTFTGPETGAGGAIVLAPNENNGIYIYPNGGVSIGTNNQTSNFYSSLPFALANNFYLSSVGSPGSTDRISSWNLSSFEADTINGYNWDTAAFFFQYQDQTPYFKHIYPSTIGASPFNLTSSQIIAGLGYTPASTSGGSNSSNGIGSGTVTYAAGVGAGSGATVSVDGTNEGGLITLTTGTSLVPSGGLVTLTYSTPFPHNSYPITRAANAATAPVETTDQATYLSGSASGFSIVASSNVLSANTTYQWYYSVSGR